jgi:ApaG protein
MSRGPRRAALAPVGRPRDTRSVSEALTSGVRVTVRSEYLPHRSSPDERRYVFAYTVVIANEGIATVKLRSRHWVITDGRGRVEEVRGQGVVGEQPQLEPGESFQYTSGCVLETPQGVMHGTYQMLRTDGSAFDAEISPFVLATPGAQAKRVLN